MQDGVVINIPPPPHHVGLFPQMMQHPGTIALKLKEKFWSWSGDDFAITDAGTNMPFMKISGKTFSLHQTKKVYDLNGRHLFTIKGKHFHLHKTWVGVTEEPEEKEIFRVQAKMFTLHHEMTATFANVATGQETEIVIRGDWLDRKAQMRLGQDGPLVAQIDRKFFNAAQIFADNQTYYAYVAPNVDLSLIAALCVILDERTADNKAGS